MSDPGTNDTNGPKPVILKHRAWCFTWNSYPSTFKEILSQKFADCEEFHYQEEIGTNGTPHLQGCMKWKNARSFASIKKLLPEAHLEVCKNWNASKLYCKKNDTRSGIVVSHEPGKRVIADPLENKTLYEWQKKLLDMVATAPDERSIHWVIDQEGGAGKTSFCKSLCLKYPNQVLYITGKASDMKYGVKTFLDNEKNDLRIVLLDFTRSVENFVSYQGIEEIKNGIFYNTKYESGMVIFNSPHVICFSNFEPNLEALSEDRWKVEYVERYSETPLPSKMEF